MQNLKNISCQFDKYYGPNKISIPSEACWNKLFSEQPIFIFDYFSLSTRLRTCISNNICEQSGLNPHSLDIIYIDGQDEILKEDELSF